MQYDEIIEQVSQSIQDDFGVVSGTDLLAADFDGPVRREALAGNLWFGPWRYKPETAVVELPGRYEVDLERCPTSPAVLDWIAQVSNKRWADAEVVAGLVHALNVLLDLQQNLCGGGFEQGPIDEAHVLKTQGFLS